MKDTAWALQPLNADGSPWLDFGLLPAEATPIAGSPGAAMLTASVWMGRQADGPKRVETYWMGVWMMTKEVEGMGQIGPGHAHFEQRIEISRGGSR